MNIASISPPRGASTRTARLPDWRAQPSPMPVIAVKRGCENGEITRRMKETSEPAIPPWNARP